MFFESSTEMLTFNTPYNLPQLICERSLHVSVGDDGRQKQAGVVQTQQEYQSFFVFFLQDHIRDIKVKSSAHAQTHTTASCKQGMISRSRHLILALWRIFFF